MAKEPTHRYVRVKRAFLSHGKEHLVGALVNLPIAVAREAVASNKAEFADPPLQPAAPAVPELAEAPLPVKTAKASKWGATHN